MFRSTARSLRTWWVDFSDDILGADLPDAVDDATMDALEHHLNHPHREPLRSTRLRRKGAVAPRAAHCLSPVRSQDPGVPAGLSAADRPLAR